MTEKVYLGTEHIRRATALGSREIRWADADLVSIGLQVDVGPRHGRYGVESRGRALHFRTRPDAFGPVLDHLQRSCPGSVFLDDATGRITPPQEGTLADIRDRMRRVSARASRRYMRTAMLQVACLPLLWLLWLVNWGNEVAFYGYMPFGPGSIRASFRKARAARESYEQYITAHGSAGGAGSGGSGA